MACRALSALVLLAALGLLLPAAGVQPQRSWVKSQRLEVWTQKANQLSEILHRQMPELRHAIWEELGVEPWLPLTADQTDAARKLLAEEANYLAAEDTLSADALQDFARSGLVPSLSFRSFADRQAGSVMRRPLQQSDVQMESLESQETILQRDAQGRLVKTTRQCKGKRCVTEEEVEEEEVEPEAKPRVLYFGNRGGGRSAQMARGEEAEEAWVLQDDEQAEPDDLMASAADMVGPAVRVVARNLAKDLRSVMKGSGLPPIGNIVAQVMNSDLAKEVKESMSPGSVATKGNGKELEAAGFGKLFNGLVGGKLLFPGNFFDVSKAIGSALKGAESVSSVTTMENGHTVRRVRRCSHGECTTAVEES